jgi:hypothetical protein
VSPYPHSAFDSHGITKDNGVRIPLGGSTQTPGSEHYKFHQYMESFWDQYRKGGPLFGRQPTITNYNRALYDALNYVGLTREEVRNAMILAIGEQRGLKIGPHDTVDLPQSRNIPKTVNVRLRRPGR